jgi:VIT1/CCC1 family predicted Fe2+/Mn2+ transporter/rubrerythrin
MSEAKDSKKAEAIEALEHNWLAEKESARVYHELSARETDDRRKAILQRMAEAEDRHAARWEKKLVELGAKAPPLLDTWRKRINRWFNRQAGIDVALRRMEAAEDRDTARYEAQQKHALGEDAEAQKILKEIALEEKAHAHVLQNLVPQIGPQTTLDSILKRERWHGRGGSWVADAIYGVNDGLGSVFGIVSGVAGATNNQQHYVLISGLAGMIASALSMGAGAWLAVKSEREVYEAEISREKQEIEENPEEEKEEMSLFYQLQGFSEADAQRMAEKIAQDPEQMVKAMAQSELGLSERHFPNPWISSFSAAASTAVGAFIPIIPFFFMGGFDAVMIAFAISIAAHFAVGAAKSLITMRSWWASGLEMTLVGVLEAAVTYSLGLAFGAAA